jgi:hypothetical protein
MSDDALLGFLENFDHWAWWITALVLFIVELAAPGIFFLWLGVAAAITGFVAFFAPGLGWQIDFVIFAVLGVIATIIGRRFYKPSRVPSSDPTLNQRGAQYVGQVFVLETALENGHGRIRIGDGSWLVEGPDLPAGARVRVTGTNGAKLKVEKA